ncbi:MAG TPA: hypothetical protein VNT27_15320 [Propionibacteriaceae bacterium]|nr:hypothetical protein [Propionibacteriaceae bacterium]
MTTCFIAEAMDGAFCLKLSAVRPLAAVCNSANAVFTCCTLGWRTGEAEASAASRLVLTLAIAVFSAATPSSAGFTFVSASSDDLSAATSSQAAAVGPAVVGAAAVDAGAAGVGGLVWLGVELVPQLPRTQSRATAATAADADRRARWSRIWVFS